MGVEKAVQWAQHISTIQLAEHFGVKESISNLLSLARFSWLGHVAQMPHDCIPKRILFG